MIIHIRGANGSGKSTCVRRVLELYESEPHFVEGRKRPLFYSCTSDSLIPVKIMGAYDIPSGGCDNIPQVATVFDTVEMLADAGHNVVFEGILAQHSAGRLLDLHMKHPVTVIVITTSLEDCIASVLERRHARGQMDPFDPRNVQKEFRSVISSTKRLRNDGLPVSEMSREEAFAFCRASLMDRPHVANRLEELSSQE